MRLFRRKSTKEPAASPGSDGKRASTADSPKLNPTASPHASGRKSPANAKGSGSGLPPLNLTSVSPATLALANESLAPATLPAEIAAAENKWVEVRLGNVDGHDKVAASAAVFVSTWNMQGCSIPPSAMDIAEWIPFGFEIYAIAVQDCKNTKTLQKKIVERLGGDTQIHSFKYKELGDSLALLLFASKRLVRAGVLKETRLNGLVTFEVKNKSLVTSTGTGRGCILMQIHFHNTTIAFVAVRFHGEDPQLRANDAEFVMLNSGIVQPEVTEQGTPTLKKVEHVFLFGDFGVRASPSVKPEHFKGTSTKSIWSQERWDAMQSLPDDDFSQLLKKCTALDQFDEILPSYPPSSRRRVYADTRKPEVAMSPRGPRTLVSASFASSDDYQDKPRAESHIPTLEDDPISGRKERSNSLLGMFDPSYDIARLFDESLFKKQGLPSYSDRVMFRTADQRELFAEGAAGSCESLRLSSHVPVYATFRVNGVSDNLLRRWQVITGNMPPHTSTRHDERIVGGVVEQFREAVGTVEAEERAYKAERARLLALQRKCTVCGQPLSLEGGDVDLGELAAFHRGCFRCADETCNKDLMGEELMHEDGKFFCIPSYNKIYLSDCPVCGEMTKGQAITVGLKKKRYHPHCFGCAKCKKGLFNGNDRTILSFSDLDSQPYCVEDFEKMIPDYCAACRTLFDAEDPKLARAGEEDTQGYTFHVKCYVCYLCEESMATKNPESQNGMLVRDYQCCCGECTTKEEAKKKRELLIKAGKLSPEEEAGAEAESARPQADSRVYIEPLDDDTDDDDD